ncbi:MAG: helicase-exonuclease AddAB subunit AddA [Lachnospiraceae bacterium]
MGWTKQQQQVIELRNRNLLISAAAGSGKTAVLVERIIKKITDSTNPIDIDRLLVVTFTNAAAAEMRERIGDAIVKELEKHPKNTHLQRQQTLLHNAQITTIHSFCLSVIRNYFHRIELDPNFRMADEGELKLQKSDVLDSVLEEYYESANPDFLLLSETIATGKNDAPLKDAILKINTFAMSYPWVEEWLEDCKIPYQVKNLEEFEALPIAEELLSYLKIVTQQWCLQMQQCYKISSEEDGPKMYQELLMQEEKLLEQIVSSSSYQEYYEKIRGFSFGRLPAARKFAGDSEKKDKVQKLRNEVKASIKKTREQFFFQSPVQMIEDLGKNQGIAEMLIEVTLRFQKEFAKKKREKNILDFNDLEHFALQILVDEKTKEPTKTAEELQKNYEEIMIDEYQDSNYVQETILKAVSGVRSGRNNMFMVGDVKQSIYRFRMARPELFMEKYNTYTEEESTQQRIDLSTNFRSRVEVLDIVNDMFYKLMKKDIGNITYDSQAALHPNLPSELPKGSKGMFEPKILVAEPKEENQDKKDRELEARMVGNEIERMMKEQQVTEKPKTKGDSPKLRNLKYLDIVILLRSLGDWADTFVKVLGEMGIPARATTGTGYFSAAEIQTVLNLLRIIDNPRQDIPMAAVLSSPIVGLTGEDLAVIRTEAVGEKFYQAVLQREGGEVETKLKEGKQQKLSDFLHLLQKYRKKVSYTPIHELLFQLFEETGYESYVYALPGGEVKQGNLQMLIEKAIAYENTSYRGLFHFIRYMEQLQKYDVDFPLAEGKEQEDTVRIMSIHKSKGLEFPVVFVSGLGKMFNTQDIRERVVLHPQLGIGMDVLDLKRRLRTPGLTRQFLARKITIENIGEELRVLYVAMTRAKDKLILTGTLKKAEEKLSSMTSNTTEDGFLTFLSRLNAGTFLQFILNARSCYGDKYPVQVIQQETLEKTASQTVIQEEVTKIQLLAKLEMENKWMEPVAQRLSYVYPYQYEENMKTKVSVSELKHKATDLAMEEEPVKWESKKEQELEHYIPAFMEGVKEENLGTRRGTATHRILECYDFTKSPDTLGEQVKQMIEKKQVESELAELVYLPSMRKFLNSDIGKRIQRAAAQGNLYREKPFVMGLPAKQVLPESDSEEIVLIQGIVDVFFEEDDHIILLDYKTDKVRDGTELAKRYTTQLELYQEAIERALEKQVKERLLYSFCLGETISV